MNILELFLTIVLVPFVWNALVPLILFATSDDWNQQKLTQEQISLFRKEGYFPPSNSAIFITGTTILSICLAVQIAFSIILISQHGWAKRMAPRAANLHAFATGKILIVLFLLLASASATWVYLTVMFCLVICLVLHYQIFSKLVFHNNEEESFSLLKCRVTVRARIVQGAMFLTSVLSLTFSIFAFKHMDDIEKRIEKRPRYNTYPVAVIAANAILVLAETVMLVHHCLWSRILSFKSLNSDLGFQRLSAFLVFRFALCGAMIEPIISSFFIFANHWSMCALLSVYLLYVALALFASESRKGFYKREGKEGKELDANSLSTVSIPSVI